MNSSPIAWNKLIDLLSKKFDTPIVAGGAVRDYQLGVQPKDIDVFVFGVAGGSDEIKAAYPWLQPMEKESSNEYSTMKDVQVVWEGTWEKLKINVVWMEHVEKDGESLVSTFDFGLCRIWWEPLYMGPNKTMIATSSGVICETASFKKDLAHKTVTMLIDDKKERSIKRFKRFNERHGDLFTLVHPDGTPISLTEIPNNPDEEIPF